jgi:alcohol dehydrogenase class IV
MITPFYLPIKFILGAGSIDQLGEEARRVGQKALIVTYSDIRRLGVVDGVIKNLEANGVKTVVFEELEPNPRTST